MRKLLSGIACLLLILGSFNAYAAPVSSGSQIRLTNFQTNSGITANTQILTFSGSTTIKIYGINGIQLSGTAGNMTLAYGTGVVCATGLTTLISISGQNGNFNINNNLPIVIVPVNNNLCLYVAGTVPSLNLTVTYVQE